MRATRRLRRSVALALVLLAAAFPLPAAHAQEAASLGVEAEIPTAPVHFDGFTLFRVRGTSSYPAEQRAQVIEQRILAVARDPGIRTEEIVVAQPDWGLEIRARDQVLARLVPADAALESVQLPTLAAAHRDRIARAVALYREERQPAKLLRGSALSVAATAALVALVFAVNRLFRRLTGVFERRVAARLERLESGAREVAPSRQLLAAIKATLRGAHFVALLVATDLWLQFVLGCFPWTRSLSAGLLALLVSPLEKMVAGFIDYVPSLLFLIVLAVVTIYGLRLVKLYFTALERRTIALANFDPEWALPAYRIVRTLAVALAVVMAYPYLPGSGSEALRGISVLGGLMLSLGASVAVSNVIAGYVNTFGRVFRAGDLIQLGEVRGEVTQVGLLTTQLRTAKNEEVTLPNASFLNGHVVNLSTLAQSRGLILHTEVGIGYEVPWRQVHAMLEEAARRTQGVSREPAPFILQRSLGDFAVVYELNVYTHAAAGILVKYSELHQNVLDVFNEHGVQIMTPAYEGDPAQPKLVPKEAWYAAPAKPPQGS
jgi:small-conductance mechanosensitive channel